MSVSRERRMIKGSSVNYAFPFEFRECWTMNSVDQSANEMKRGEFLVKVHLRVAVSRVLSSSCSHPRSKVSVRLRELAREREREREGLLKFPRMPIDSRLSPRREEAPRLLPSTLLSFLSFLSLVFFLFFGFWVWREWRDWEGFSFLFWSWVFREDSRGS